MSSSVGLGVSNAHVVYQHYLYHYYYYCYYYYYYYYVMAWTAAAIPLRLSSRKNSLESPSVGARLSAVVVAIFQYSIAFLKSLLYHSTTAA